MKKYVYLLLIILICFWLSGCATVDTVRTSNRESLMRLHIGMSKEEVLKIIGTKTIITSDSITGIGVSRINNPYRTETLMGKDKALEVLYYYTDLKKLDGAITDDELTPLIFDDGKLIGWGWSFLEESKNKYEIRIR